MQLKKMTLFINGADRAFICDPATDTLATVIRRLGLTGTKVGCGTGVCGSCSLILNGKVIRSCSKKISTVEEYSSVTTIEGIGSPNNLHPLQVAWMNYGGVQCGFCTPGFIVSAYALLQENKSPTREEVRDWFQAHRNICRCTGYKQLVDAVMAAAKVMRGECSIKDIEISVPATKDTEFYGRPLVRPAALAKVCGVCDFGDDIELKMPSSTLHVAMVQPKVTNHAKLLKINTEEAEKMPGVYKIITSKDVKGSNRLAWFTFTPRTLATEATHILLAEDKIFTYGEIVALVAADTKEHARAAAAKVTVEIEQLPEYMNYLDAAMPDAIRIHEDHPNVWSMQPTIKGENVEPLMKSAPNVVEGSFYSTREPHMPIEGDTVQAYWGDDGLLTIQCKAMCIYANIGDISAATGVDADKIRVIQNPTGGTFGWGIAGATYSLAAIACLCCDDMPVAFSMTYAEFMAYSGKRCPSYANGRLACDKEGKIIAAEWDCGLDHGAYNELGDDIISRIARFMFFPYNVPNCQGLGRVASTNHSYGTAYRGYGSPQAYTTSEALIDMMAEKMGMDPFEIRWRNIARPGDLNVNQFPFVEYPMEAMMKLMKPIYDKAVAEAKAKDTPQKRRGVGLAWGGYNVTEGTADQCTVAIELRDDGKFVKYDTWQDQGQGGDVGSLHVTLEALKPLGVKLDDIVLIQNDSKYCPDSGSTASSRSHYMNSKASNMAAEQLIKGMKKADGAFRTYKEMVAEGIPTKYEAQYENPTDPDLSNLDPNTGKGNPTPEFTYALFLSEVEVDTATGKTTVIGYTCVDDVGVIGDIASVDGQAYGGLSHCIGFALTENYDDVKKHNNMAGAGIPQILDIPDKFDIIHHCSPRKKNPFGSSGASEAYQSSGHMAVINAINNACGVRIYELPASPAKVKAGIEVLAKGGKIAPPKKYFLGSDLQEEIEQIKANPISE